MIKVADKLSNVYSEKRVGKSSSSFTALDT